MAKTNIEYKNKILNISYEIINQNLQNSILILHGWGANKELMKNTFCNNLQDFKQIYLDLPGFGNSSIEDVFDSYDYKNCILEFLKNKNLNVNYLLGHSFGGKICILLANEIKANNLILLSSAGILKQKSLKTKAKIFIFKILKNIGFGNFYKFFASKDVKNMNKTMYKTFKKVVDEDLKDQIAKINTNTTIFWGKDDDATPLYTGEIMHSLIKNSEFFPMDGDHFFFIKQNIKICEKVNSLKEKNA